MKLDARLNAVAEFVNKNTVLADIGTDHAYLPVYLLQKGIIKKAIASDLRQGPLNNAKNTLEEYGLSDMVELRISDGLDNYIAGEAQEIAICGMGGLLISSFIERTEWLKNSKTHLILQPMTHIEDTRKALCKNGFCINDEKVVKDGNKYYIVISAYYDSAKKNYPDFTYAVGFFEKESELGQEYLNKLYMKYYEKCKALKDSGHDFRDIEMIVKEIEKWLR